MKNYLVYVLLPTVGIFVVVCTTPLEHDGLFQAMYLSGLLLVSLISDLEGFVPFHIEATVYQGDHFLDPSTDFTVCFADNANGEGGSNQAGPSNEASSEVGASNQSFTRITHVPEESITHYHGIANAADAAVRDRVIANGYNPAETNQPYASKLAAKLNELGVLEQHKSIPRNLTSKDADYLRMMHPLAHDPYKPNLHYANTVSVRRFLTRLP